jgi:hydrogenase maturation protein HypF
MAGSQYDAAMRMHRITVKGVVQGVGFRPYIYRKAVKLGLAGSVRNFGGGVEIIVNDAGFAERLTDLPPLARIEECEVEALPPGGPVEGFRILESSDSEGTAQLPADIFTCGDCLRELRDPRDRRFGYYFITCTNCGPRYSMIEDYPYDRPNTSMNAFRMCARCGAEYADPRDRRYHAQTIACKDCGPRLMLLYRGRDASGGTDEATIRKAASLIRAGKLVSVKGVGGFHVCSRSDDATATKVKKFLGRPHKPFALMVRDLAMLKGAVACSKAERALLAGPQRPIVILRKRMPCFCGVSELDSLGVMLPYTALHHMLFDHIDEPLLMTSCNAPGEPVEVSERLGSVFLTHGRRIVNRCDDSVVKVIGGMPFFLRRSRGYAPLPVRLPAECADTFAAGAELNGVVCAVKGRDCVLSQYVGETSKKATFDFMRDASARLMRLTRLRPEIVACDLHPRYNSAAFAGELAKEHGAELVAVQHHKAHVASVAAEHGLADYVGIAVDGMGYGEDGKIWGGEVFDVRDGTGFTRIGSLQEQPQLGGDEAARRPGKMLFGIVAESLGREDALRLRLFPKAEAETYLRMLSERFNTPMTSSAGRVLDAAAALLGICGERTYDGRPAMLLESAATRPLRLAPEYVRQGGMTVLSTGRLFRFLLDNREEERGRLAATAQAYLARGLLGIAEEAAGGRPIVLSGGVAYNRMISGIMLGKGVLANREIPAGDGGVCLGQAYLANLLSE